MAKQNSSPENSSKEIRMRDIIHVFHRMRPRNLAEYVGQYHLVGPGKELLEIYNAAEIPPMILYGSPGTGKTTIAQLLAQKADYRSVDLHLIGKGLLSKRTQKNYKEILKEALVEFKTSGKKTVLLLDEMHRMTKEQQELLLKMITRGGLTFIGTTYRDPESGLLPGLRPKCKIIRLEKLKPEDLVKILHSVLTDKERGLGRFRIKCDTAAVDFLCTACDGSARTMIRMLERELLRQFLFYKSKNRSTEGLTFHITSKGVRSLVDQ